VIPALGLVAAIFAAPAGVDPSKLSALQSKSFQNQSDSLAKAAIASRDSLARADSNKVPVDSAQRKRLPDRVLPLSQQMMYAGGFMVFLALMISSLQNFNPND